MKELELYVHIPFCVRKCNYCDFLSAPADEKAQNEYVAALLNEIEIRSGAMKDCTVSSIYIGGGTPSVLVPGKVTEILCKLKNCFFISKDAEITIEVNPGTTNLCKLKEYKAAGINRISIGCQSANEEELRMLGRIHDFAEFQKCYDMVRQVGFDNVNVDLMTALPRQDISKLNASIDAVLGLKMRPEHISAYSLIIEENTPFYEQFKECDGPVVGEEMERKLYWHMVNRLADAGYVHYEISNFAYPGYESRHNSGYWTGVSYMGLGLGASSYLPKERCLNAATGSIENCNVAENRDGVVNGISDQNSVGIVNINNAENGVLCRVKNLSDITEYKRVIAALYNNSYINSVVCEQDAEKRVNCDAKQMYCDAKQQPEMAQGLFEEYEIMSTEDLMSEYMFLGLRMMCGVSSAEFEKRFRCPLFSVYGEEIKHLEREGMLKLIYEDNDSNSDNVEIMLTNKGIDYGNYVFASFV